MKVQIMQKIGAVLIVGGGIAGIQAALDLAELGYKVYLVGDCVEPRRIVEAILEGFRIGLEV